MKITKRFKRFCKNLSVSLILAAVAAAAFNSYTDAHAEFIASPEATSHAEIIEYFKGLVVTAPALEPIPIVVEIQ